MAKGELTIDGVLDGIKFSPITVTIAVGQTKITTSGLDLELTVAGKDGQSYIVKITDYRGQVYGLKDGADVTVKGRPLDGKSDYIKPDTIEAWGPDVGKYTLYKI